MYICSFQLLLLTLSSQDTPFYEACRHQYEGIVVSGVVITLACDSLNSRVLFMHLVRLAVEVLRVRVCRSDSFVRRRARGRNDAARVQYPAVFLF